MLLDYLEQLQAAPAPAPAVLGGYSEDPRFFHRRRSENDVAIALLLGDEMDLLS